MKAMLACLAFVAACGPSHINVDGGADDTVGGDDDTAGPHGSLEGTVWAPGNAIGMVPAGYEIPVAGALVYLSSEPPDPIPDGVYCDRCAEHPYLFTTSDDKGKFELTDIPAGDHLLTIEKAQFRLTQTVHVGGELGTALTAEQTTLPSVYDPANGKWIPKVAIATGDSDHIEDVFAKMGILDVGTDGSATEASLATSDRVELWGNPIDPPHASIQKGTITDLFSSLDTMKRYHIIFVPCNYESDVTALSTPQVRQNIRDYVAAGGKLYVTDWSAEWEDAAFPEFIAFDPSTDTTPAMAAAGDINPGDGDFGGFAMHSRADDDHLRTWLDGQKAPLVVPAGGEDQDFPATFSEGVTDSSDFVIEGSWSLIRSLPTVTIGTDDQGHPVTETAKTWITADYQGAFSPHTVTFEPSCGRVLYSTYHTATEPHQYLAPQERVLLYLIMEIGVCNDGPIVQ